MVNSFLNQGIEQRSGEWGIEPWHAYFTKYIIKIAPMPCITILICVILSIQKSNLYILAPAFLHLGCMSIIGHKEWRFIMYIVPILNVYSSLCFSTLKNSTINYGNFRNKKNRHQKTLRQARSFETLKSICSKNSPAVSPRPLSKLNPAFTHEPILYKDRLILSFLKLLLVLSFLASLGMLYISSLNYPGAEGITQLHNSLTPGERCYVHIDSYAGIKKTLI